MPPWFVLLVRPLTSEYLRATRVSHLMAHGELGSRINDKLPSGVLETQKEIEVFISKEETWVWPSPGFDNLSSDQRGPPRGDINRCVGRRLNSRDMWHGSARVPREYAAIGDYRTDAGRVRKPGIQIMNDAIGPPDG